VRRFFVLVPSLRRTGPVNGAVALVNGLCIHREATLVALKPGSGVEADVDPRVHVVRLGTHRSWRGRLKAYKKLLTDAGGRPSVGSISFCLSADAVNVFCNRVAVTCAGVRGNLPMNYRMDYGTAGAVLAVAHLSALRACDVVVSMTDSMAEQVSHYIGGKPEVIGNFVDEGRLERYRRHQVENAGPLRFVYLASLSLRKQPLLVVDAVHELNRSGIDAELDIIGDGRLRPRVTHRIEELGIQDCVRVHGEMDYPYSVLAAADALVLPSLSEGLSRASLEALFLGVPCVLRDVDGNAELIEDGVNGSLFQADGDLALVMSETAAWSRRRQNRRNLLPDVYRQDPAVRRYREILEART
jgi:glycosyltransferase involved in cell wall biosynthesis